MIEAARALFLTRGYGETSISAIAEAAGVSVPTVYANFESKPGILARVIDVAVAGDEEEGALARERPGFVDVFAPGMTARARIATFAAAARAVHARSAPLIALLESVAGTDEALRTLAAAMRDGVRQDARAGAEAFGPGELRAELDLDAVTDALWIVAGPATYNLFVGHAGHTDDEYESWLDQRLANLLLPDRRARTSARHA